MVRHIDLSADEAIALIATLYGPWRCPKPSHWNIKDASVITRGMTFEIGANGFVSRFVEPRAVGSVVPTGEATSQIVARIGSPSARSFEAFLLPTALAVYLAWQGSLSEALILGALVAFMYAIGVGKDRGVTYAGTPVARLLADHLDSALAPHLSADQTPR